MANYPAIATYVRRRASSPDDVADVIAETFTTAWRRLPDIPPKAEEARLWLYGVARRVLANHFRAEQRRSALAVRLREEVTTWADAVVRDDSAQRAFQRLSDDDREVLALVAWEGLKGPEIAKVLGCSRGAARLRLHRARKRLARELSQIDPDLARRAAQAVPLTEGPR